jgi:hypothetical protein
LASVELIVQEGTYFSPGDEAAFYHRLETLRCVSSVKGAFEGLHIVLSKPPSDAELRELIALLYRYDLDMTPLAVLRTKRNAAWFADNKEAFWHVRVFRAGNSP